MTSFAAADTNEKASSESWKKLLKNFIIITFYTTYCGFVDKKIYKHKNQV